MTELITVSTTTENKQDASRIASTLVENRLAACVQIHGPVESTYRWEGKVETAMEWICTAKTERRLYDRVECAIQDLHPYDVPEIIALPILEVSRSYRKWCEDQLKDQ